VLLESLLAAAAGAAGAGLRAEASAPA